MDKIIVSYSGGRVEYILDADYFEFSVGEVHVQLPMIPAKGSLYSKTLKPTTALRSQLKVC